MQLNVGSTDRVIRILLGIALLTLGIFHVVAGAWAISAYIVGVIALATGLFRFCPAWAVCGINTSSTKPIQQK
jgi:uncharacterized membrane protein HdeD (DUF308 family)